MANCGVENMHREKNKLACEVPDGNNNELLCAVLFWVKANLKVQHENN